MASLISPIIRLITNNAVFIDAFEDIHSIWNCSLGQNFFLQLEDQRGLSFFVLQFWFCQYTGIVAGISSSASSFISFAHPGCLSSPNYKMT